MSVDHPAVKNQGPWSHRFLIVFFSIALGVLVFWLLGFVMDDIGTWEGPSYEALEKSRLDPAVVEQRRGLDRQINDTERAIADQRERQDLLEKSTTNSKQTMNQLLEFQRLALQKNVAPSPEEQKALAESQQRFLTNQNQYQALNEHEVEINEKLRELRRQQEQVDARLTELRSPIYQEFERIQRQHELKVAAAKLGALLPVLLLAVVLFLRARGGLYAPLTYALGLAVLLQVVLVMHEYFPTRYFKYVLILVTIAVVVRILFWLLRMVAFPKADWLLKQYREAYEAFLCPQCSYPIRRGPLKYLTWTRRSLPKLSLPPSAGSEPEEPYTCPMCSTRLFEECPDCHSMRHSLLPACQHCGATKRVVATA